jgi:isoleucyl-tRNA synthetase
MPYAQLHYPFENKEKFHETFPADFISEGIDQTRGWFYTLLVIATLLFDTAPWKNLIASGLVLAAYVVIQRYDFKTTHAFGVQRREKNEQET